MSSAGTTLEQARRFALALPESIEAPHFQSTSFRVRGAKIVGLRIHLASAPQGVVAALFEAAWRAKAPKALQ